MKENVGTHLQAIRRDDGQDLQCVLQLIQFISVDNSRVPALLALSPSLVEVFEWWSRGSGQHIQTGVSLSLFNIITKSSIKNHVHLVSQCVAICRSVLKDRMHSLYSALSKYSPVKTQKAALEFLGLQNVLSPSLTKILLDDFNFGNASLKHMLTNHGPTHLDSIRFVISFMCTPAPDLKVKFMNIKNILKLVTHRITNDTTVIKLELVTLLTHHVLGDERTSKRAKSTFLSVPALVKISHFLSSSESELQEATALFFDQILDFKKGILYNSTEEDIFGDTSSNPILLNFIKYSTLHSESVFTLATSILPKLPELFPVLLNMVLGKQTSEIEHTLVKVHDIIKSFSVAALLPSLSEAVSDEQLLDYLFPPSLAKALEKQLKSSECHPKVGQILASLLSNINDAMRKYPNRSEIRFMAIFKLPGLGQLQNMDILATDVAIKYLQLDKYCLYNVKIDLSTLVEIGKDGTIASEGLKLLSFLPCRQAEGFVISHRDSVIKSLLRRDCLSCLLFLRNHLNSDNDSLKMKILLLYYCDLKGFEYCGQKLNSILKPELETLVTIFIDHLFHCSESLSDSLETRAPTHASIVNEMRFKSLQPFEDIKVANTDHRSSKKRKTDHATSFKLSRSLSKFRNLNEKCPYLLLAAAAPLNNILCELGFSAFCEVSRQLLKDTESRQDALRNILVVLCQNFNSDDLIDVEEFIRQLQPFFKKHDTSWCVWFLSDCLLPTTEHSSYNLLALPQDLTLLASVLKNKAFCEGVLRNWEILSKKYFYSSEERFIALIINFFPGSLPKLLSKSSTSELIKVLESTQLSNVEIQVQIVDCIKQQDPNYRFSLTVEDVKGSSSSNVDLNVAWRYLDVTDMDTASYVLENVNAETMIKIALMRDEIMTLSKWFESKKRIRALVEVFDQYASLTDLKSFLGQHSVVIEAKIPIFMKKLIEKKVNSFLQNNDLSILSNTELYISAFPSFIRPSLPSELLQESVTRDQCMQILLSHQNDLKEPLLRMIHRLLTSSHVDVSKDVSKSIVLLFQECYTASNSTVDQIILSILKECHAAGVVNKYPFGFGPYVRELSQIKNLSLYSEVCIKMVEDFDKTKLQNLINHFPLHPDEVDNLNHSDSYSLEYILSFMIFILENGQVEARTFLSHPVFHVILLSLSSYDDVTRSTGYTCMEKLSYLVAGESFREKGMCTYVLGMLQNSVTEENQRLPHLMTYTLGIMISVLFTPHQPIYLDICHFLLQRPTLDFTDVPLFYSLFCSSTLAYRTVQNWLLKVLVVAVRTEEDYRILSRRHVLPICMSQFHTPLTDKYTLKLIRTLVGRCWGIKSSYVKRDLEASGVLESLFVL